MMDIEALKTLIINEIKIANERAEAEYSGKKQELEIFSKKAKDEFSSQTDHITEADYEYIDQLLENLSLEEIDEQVAETLLESEYDEYDYFEMYGELNASEVDIYTKFYNHNKQQLKSNLDATKLHISEKILETIIKWRYAIMLRNAQIKYNAKRNAQKQAYSKYEEEAKYSGINKNKAFEKIYDKYYSLYIVEHPVNSQKLLQEVLQVENGIDMQSVRNDAMEQYNSPEIVINNIQDTITQNQKSSNLDLVINIEDIKSLQNKYQKSISIDQNVDILSAKIAVQSISPTEISKEFLEQIKQLTKTNEDLSQELVQICLEKYANSLDLNNLENSQMEFLYENNYNGDFQNNTAKKLYSSYCREQTQIALITQQEEQLKQKDQQIDILNGTIANKDSQIRNLQTNNTALTTELSERNEQITNLQTSNQEKDSQIKDERAKKTEAENEISTLKESNSNLIETVKSLTRNNEELNSQNQYLKRENTNQLIVINAHKRRSYQLELLIENQRKVISGIMKHIMKIKEISSGIKQCLKPKNFLQKIASKFMQDTNQSINSASDEIHTYVNFANNLANKSEPSNPDSLEDCILEEQRTYLNRINNPVKNPVKVENLNTQK